MSDTQTQIDAARVALSEPEAKTGVMGTLAAASLAGGVGCCASQLAGTRSVAVKLRAPCSVCTTP